VLLRDVLLEEAVAMAKEVLLCVEIEAWLVGAVVWTLLLDVTG